MMIGAMRRAFSIPPLVLAVVSLSACGGDSSNSSSQPGGTPTPLPSTSTPTPPPTGGVVKGYVSLVPKPGSSFSSFTTLIGLSYNGDPANGQAIPGSEVSGNDSWVAFKYDRYTQTYSLVAIEPSSQKEGGLIFSTLESATDPNYTDSKFIVYSDAGNILRLYRSVPANPELNLTFSGLGNLEGRGPELGHSNFGDSWFSYGAETRTTDIPTNGIGNYSGVVHGFAIDPVAGIQYRVEGTASFVLNFQNRKASGTVNMTLITDGSVITVGEATFSDATFTSVDGVQLPFGGTLTGPAVPNGSLETKLYGPSALEISGTFAARVAVASASGDITVHGALAAVKN